MSALATFGKIDRALCAGVDPLFGASLSRAEQALWESILLGGKRRQRTWRDWLKGLDLKFFGGNPFGSRSGGAGGNASTPEVPSAGEDFGNAYPWLYPTADFRNFDKYGTVLLPAAGAATQASIGGTVANNVITLNAASNMPWIVPVNFNGFIKTMAVDFVANGGAAWTQGVLPPQLQFNLFINQQAAIDYSPFFYSPGVVTAPSPLAGVPIKEQQLVQMFVTNLTLVNTTQFVEARLQGYYYGKQFEPKGLAF